MSPDVIHIDFSKKCIHCGEGGATPSGRCLECVLKLMKKFGLDRAKWPRSGKIAR